MVENIFISRISGFRIFEVAILEDDNKNHDDYELSNAELVDTVIKNRRNGWNYINGKFSKPAMEITLPDDSEWYCMSCGTINPNTVKTCQCGRNQGCRCSNIKYHHPYCRHK